jgi:hypothetical protein
VFFSYIMRDEPNRVAGCCPDDDTLYSLMMIGRALGSAGRAASRFRDAVRFRAGAGRGCLCFGSGIPV